MTSTQDAPQLSISNECSEPPAKALCIQGVQILQGPPQPALIKPCPSNIKTMTFTLPKNFQFLRTPIPPNIAVHLNLKRKLGEPEEESQLVPQQEKSPNLIAEKIQDECKALLVKMIDSPAAKTPSNTNPITNLKQLLKCEPRRFLKLCLDTLSEIEQSTNLGSRPSTSAVKENSPAKIDDSPKMEVETQYDKIQPILGKAGATIALLEDSSDSKKIISIFGKKLFDALFDKEEIMGGLSSPKSKKGSAKLGYGNEFDAEKVCMIARCLSWLISKPRCLSIQDFKVYEAELMQTRETGLDVYNFRYFKESILIKYGCDRRRALVREMEREQSKTPKEIEEAI